MKHKKKLRPAMVIIAVISLVAFSYCMFMIYDTIEIKDDTSNIDNLGPSAVDIDSSDMYEKTEDDLKNSEQDRQVKDWAKDLLAKNSDAIGWIRIPGFTDENGKEYINYPVFKCSNNDYYLYRNIDGYWDQSGSIYADYRTTIDENGQSDNIVMYGHHMRRMGTAFTHLAEYKSGIDMLKKYPFIEFNSIYEEGEVYAIVSVYVAAVNKWQDPNLFPYWMYYDFDKTEKKNDSSASSSEKDSSSEQDSKTDDSNTDGYEERPDAKDPETSSDYTDFETWKEKTLLYSWYNADISCDIDDKYITLSTCSNEVPYMRLVIVARKLKRTDNRKAILESYSDKPEEEIYFPPVWTNWWGHHRKYLGWYY